MLHTMSMQKAFFSSRTCNLLSLIIGKEFEEKELSWSCPHAESSVLDNQMSIDHSIEFYQSRLEKSRFQGSRGC